MQPVEERWAGFGPGKSREAAHDLTDRGWLALRKPAAVEKEEPVVLLVALAGRGPCAAPDLLAKVSARAVT